MILLYINSKTDVSSNLYQSVLPEGLRPKDNMSVCLNTADHKSSIVQIWSDGRLSTLYGTVYKYSTGSITFFIDKS